MRHKDSNKFKWFFLLTLTESQARHFLKISHSSIINKPADLFQVGFLLCPPATPFFFLDYTFLAKDLWVMVRFFSSQLRPAPYIKNVINFVNCFSDSKGWVRGNIAHSSIFLRWKPEAKNIHIVICAFSACTLSTIKVHNDLPPWTQD